MGKARGFAIKFEEAFLQSLVEDENSGVFLDNCSYHLALHPSQLNSVKNSVKEELSKRIAKYDKNVNGILMGFKNIKHNVIGAIGIDNCFIHLDVRADFFVFRPEIGVTLKGTVMIVTEDHVGCLVYNTFNVSLTKNETEDDWLGSNANVGDEAEFEIAFIELEGRLPYIRGKLISLTPQEESNENTTVSQIFENTIIFDEDDIQEDNFSQKKNKKRKTEDVEVHHKKKRLNNTQEDNIEELELEEEHAAKSQKKRKHSLEIEEENIAAPKKKKNRKHTICESLNDSEQIAPNLDTEPIKAIKKRKKTVEDKTETHKKSYSTEPMLQNNESNRTINSLLDSTRKDKQINEKVKKKKKKQSLDSNILSLKKEIFTAGETTDEDKEDTNTNKESGRKQKIKNFEEIETVNKKTVDNKAETYKSRYSTELNKKVNNTDDVASDASGRTISSLLGGAKRDLQINEKVKKKKKKQSLDSNVPSLKKEIFTAGETTDEDIEDTNTNKAYHISKESARKQKIKNFEEIETVNKRTVDNKAETYKSRYSVELNKKVNNTDDVASDASERTISSLLGSAKRDLQINEKVKKKKKKHSLDSNISSLKKEIFTAGETTDEDEEDTNTNKESARNKKTVDNKTETYKSRYSADLNKKVNNADDVESDASGRTISSLLDSAKKDLQINEKGKKKKKKHSLDSDITNRILSLKKEIFTAGETTDEDEKHTNKTYISGKSGRKQKIETVGNKIVGNKVKTYKNRYSAEPILQHREINKTNDVASDASDRTITSLLSSARKDLQIKRQKKHSLDSNKILNLKKEIFTSGETTDEDREHKKLNKAHNVKMETFTADEASDQVTSILDSVKKELLSQQTKSKKKRSKSQSRLGEIENSEDEEAESRIANIMQSVKKEFLNKTPKVKNSKKTIETEPNTKETTINMLLNGVRNDIMGKRKKPNLNRTAPEPSILNDDNIKKNKTYSLDLLNYNYINNKIKIKQERLSRAPSEESSYKATKKKNSEPDDGSLEDLNLDSLFNDKSFEVAPLYSSQKMKKRRQSTL